MPARAVVHIGDEAARDFWIEQMVFRVGSDMSADLYIEHPGINPHAMTVEYRDGDYLVYNRGSGTYYMEGEPLAPGESTLWLPENGLRLNAEVTIYLETKGDPAPSRKPQTAQALPEDLLPEEEDPAEEKGKEEEKKSAGSIMQLAVIGICALLIPILLLQDQEPSDSGPDDNRPQISFQKLIGELSGDPLDRSAGPFSVRFTLQDAREAEIRGDTKLSLVKYAFAIQMIARRGDPENGIFASEADKLAWQFIQSRLRRQQSATDS